MQYGGGRRQPAQQRSPGMTRQNGQWVDPSAQYRAKPADLNQWKQMQDRWAREPAGPQLPLWTQQQLQQAGVMVGQQMPWDHAQSQFNAASQALTRTINPTMEQHIGLTDAYDQAKANMNASRAQSPQQQRMVAEGNRNFSNMQNQAAAQQAFYQQGPMTAQRVQAINADPFYSQMLQQQAPWNAPQIRYGGGPSMSYVSPQDQAMMNRTTW